MLCRDLRGCAKLVIDLIQDVEDDSTAGEARDIQRGYEPSLAGEQVADVELCQMVCDASQAHDHHPSRQCIEAILC